jgi:hypothetical protein
MVICNLEEKNSTFETLVINLIGHIDKYHPLKIQVRISKVKIYLSKQLILFNQLQVSTPVPLR